MPSARTSTDSRFSVRDVAAILGAEQLHSDSLYTVCPLHDDSVPSLSLDQDGDRLLAYCHVCCQTESTRDYFIRLIKKLREIQNYSGEHPYVQRSREAHKAIASGRIVASYQYAEGRWVKNRWEATEASPDGSFLRWFTWSTLGFDGSLCPGRTGFDGIWYRLGPERYERVWICEGESDSLALHQYDPSIAVFSPPDGAFKNSAQASSMVKSLAPLVANKPVTVVADNDEAGKRHAALLRDELVGRAASVVVLIPHEHGDLREMLEAGVDLVDGLVELDDSGDRQLLSLAGLEGTQATGYISVGPDGCLVRQRPSDRNPVVLTRAPVRVDAVSSDENGNSVWHLAIVEPDGTACNVKISVADLSGPAAYARWNAANSALMLQTKNPAEFQAWLILMGRFADQLEFVKPGQVDINGVPALVGTDSTILWSVRPIETKIEADESQDRCLTQSASTPEQSAAVVASILGFRQLSESAPALSAILATALGSVLSRLVGRPLKIVEIVGISGTAKTSWTRLAARLTGYSGSGTSDMTKAAFSRMLSSGLTTWVDDLSSGPESEAILADLRGKATGGERRIADRDQATGTIGQRMNSGLIVTLEGSLLGQTRAELDRRVSLTFEDTSVSARVDENGDKQWLAMRRLGADDVDDFWPVGQHAGNVLVGLCEQLSQMEPDPQWLKASGERTLVPVFAVQAVARALAAWLRDHGQQQVAQQLAQEVEVWVQRESEQRVAVSDSGSDLAVSRLIESFLGSAQFQLDKQLGRVYREVTEFDKDQVRHYLADAVGSSITHQAPAVIVLRCESRTVLAVCTASLLAWSTGEGGHRARVKDAVGGRKLDALQAGNQLKTMAARDVIDSVRLDITRSVASGDKHTRVRRSATYRLVEPPTCFIELL